MRVSTHIVSEPPSRHIHVSGGSQGVPETNKDDLDFNVNYTCPVNWLKKATNTVKMSEGNA